MSFVPEQPKDSQQVPFFDDVSKEAGWQGQSTTKSIKALQAEIIEAVGRLGGLVINFQGDALLTPPAFVEALMARMGKGCMRDCWPIKFSITRAWPQARRVLTLCILA